jgi:hypothetical protein
MAGKCFGVAEHMKAKIGGIKCSYIHAKALNNTPVRMMQ